MVGIGIRQFFYVLSRFLRAFINFDIAFDIIIMMVNKYCTLKKGGKTSVICSVVLSKKFIDPYKLVGKSCISEREIRSYRLGDQGRYFDMILEGEIPLNQQMAVKILLIEGKIPLI